MLFHDEGRLRHSVPERQRCRRGRCVRRREGKPELAEMLKAELPAVTVRLSLWGQMVGICPSERDAILAD